MESFAQYGHAILSMALFGLLALVLGPLSAAIKAGDGVEAGAPPAPDYANRTYRLYRAHQNALENLGIFAMVTVAAILSGAPPFWVNLFASLFFLGRLVHLFVHVRGLGVPNRGLRSMIFMVSWGCSALLAILAIIGVF